MVKMRVTKELVINFLSPEETNYVVASKLGTDALPFLDEIIKADPYLASRAVCLVGLIKHPKSISILLEAAKSPSSSVRASVALTARNSEIDDINSDKILRLLENDDEDIVRKSVTKSRLKRNR